MTDNDRQMAALFVRCGSRMTKRRMRSSNIAIDNWTTTALGSPIALHSSHTLNEQAKLRPILLMGGIHGDEPQGVRLAQDTLVWLKSQTAPLTPWIVIPCLNIDGFAKGERVNGRAVDLNRNYPSRDWSTAHEKLRYYPGPASASEPEVRSVVALMAQVQPRLVIHCHSWQPCIVATGNTGLNDAKYLGESSGYEVKDDIGYPTPGSLSSFGWHDHQIPVICIEERDDITDLSVIWPRFASGMQKIFTDLSPRVGQG